MRAGPVGSCYVRRAVRSGERSGVRRQSLRPLAAVLGDDKGGTGGTFNPYVGCVPGPFELLLLSSRGNLL